jgi:hypothetical protein
LEARVSPRCEHDGCSADASWFVRLINKSGRRWERNLCGPHANDAMDLVKEPWCRSGWREALALAIFGKAA